MTTNDDVPSARKGLLSGRSKRLSALAGVGLAALLVGGGFIPHGSAPGLAATVQAAEAVQPAPGFADLVAKVKPAVISVRVKLDQSKSSAAKSSQEFQFDPDSQMQKFFRRFGFDEPRSGAAPRRMMTGLGSGFFISADGYAVTNNHVVDGATSVQVTTDDGAIYSANVVGTDPSTDLALIKVEGKSDFPYVHFADRAPRIGDWVVAVGNPFGLGGTVTAGIVSAGGRAVGSSPYDYIQIDAPINKGNSGGPTFDVDGNVIGVNTAIFSPSGGSVGIGFDVPASTANLVIAQLKDKGHVTRGWMGVSIQPVTPDLANSLGLKEARGAIIDDPQPGSPAAKAGLQAGDVITALDGNAVKDSRDVAVKVGMLAPGTSVKLDLMRNGQSKTMTVTLGEKPAQQQANAGSESNGPTAGEPHLGLSLAPAAEVAGSGDKGLVVIDVDPNGPAADKGLKTGDVILQVAGKEVTDVSQVRKALADAHAQGKHDVLMRVKTADSTRFVAVPLRTG
jgi:serine protease Do